MNIHVTGSMPLGEYATVDRQNRPPMWASLLLTNMVLLPAFGLGYLAGSAPEFGWIYVAWVYAMLVLFLVALQLRARLARSVRARYQQSEFSRGEFSISLDEGHCTFQNSAVVWKLPWDMVIGTKETQEFFIVSFKLCAWTAVPKRLLAASQMDELRTFLRDRAQQNRLKRTASPVF
jgi:hypothetical protein